ncbi:UvrD-helicase domain-containing protein [Streptomyces sp. NEAU-Y11]|uniref:UvrD-helicase domain-containing protein n=1 Tax=Streptomyces cucumeris TaxID=2962890 RepID=UPI0020C92675|nr:UvrD-helicase domain-containing protein [Streptomyces sp. NEAU-Y11]MCP9209695.1 UvrD-helicase domain-containing protein [Streptomyces sp. NEAU-Y11]
MKFTDEQQAAIDLSLKGESFSLVAPAGSGKSATAIGMAGALRGKRVLYLVYNTQARKDAEIKFKQAGMDWVDVRTTSQIAWREYAKHGNYKDRMAPGAHTVRAKDVATRLGLEPVDFGGNVLLDGYTQAKLATDAIERFCNSNRTRITYRDVPLVILGVEQSVLDAARTYVAKLASKMWRRAIEPNSNLRFTMNYAFKLIAEDENKNYRYDVILLDEAQDSNDATMKFLENQKGAQVVLIGDPAQAMYGWRGATDQIMQFPGERLYLTQSFRFGPAIAEEAMKHLPHTGTGVTIRGLGSIVDKVSEGDMRDPDVILARTNAGVMEWAMSYLMANKRVALVKDSQAILDLAYAALSLMKGERPRNMELSGFESWAELVEYADEPGGGHLKPLVRLVQAHGVHKLIDTCKKLVPYDSQYPRHDVAVSTCHSIKGLEWGRVQLADDFFRPDPLENPSTGEWEPGPIDKNEAMIHYVGVTRAQKHLDRGGLAWIDEHVAPVKPDYVKHG